MSSQLLEQCGEFHLIEGLGQVKQTTVDWSISVGEIGDSFNQKEENYFITLPFADDFCLITTNTLYDAIKIYHKEFYN